MSLPFQPGLRRLFALLCAGVLLTGGPLLRAASSGENRAYKAAVDAFKDTVWWRAESEFERFVAKYPKSELAPDAVLLQAQARFKQGKFEPTIALLTTWLGAAGPLADQYHFWIGESQFQAGQYAAAAETYGKLVNGFPASNRRLEAAVAEAAACAKLKQWPRVVELLEKAGGPFQGAALARPESDFVVRGRLLLGEARLAQKQFAEAETALHPLALLKLPPDLDWQRQFLACRAQLGAGKIEDARKGAENLQKIATATGRRDLLAESVGLLASIHEQLGQRNEAIAVFNQNLAAEVPADRQRQALLKITELTLAQGRLSDAVKAMEQFLNQLSNSPAADAALLTLGELQLKQNDSQTNLVGAADPTTNHLKAALGFFDQLVNAHSNSTLVGKAQLGRGWCFWLSTNLPASADAFRAAAAILPPSEDLAVARFKLGDVLFVQNDFAGAAEQYSLALGVATNWPRAKASLVPQVLQQIVRANLALTNATGASVAMRELLDLHPGSDDASRSVLLVGQGFLDETNSAQAQALFQDFVTKAPGAAERPIVELLMARALEQSAKWADALALYNGWLERFPTNRSRPQVEFYRALATFHAGNETNAVNLFTNFVTQFAADEYALQARWWLAAYHYNQGDFSSAEKNYKLLFQTWPTSDLAARACMMAGVAAVSWGNFAGAIDYFTNLTSRLDCPADLWAQAVFAYGDALMARPASETNRLANYQEAIPVFAKIHERHRTNEIAALAWGEMANCYRQLRDASNAVAAYTQVIQSPAAKFAARSQAQVGLALLQEELAQTESGETQRRLLMSALDNYLDVFYYEKNLRDGEQPDWFWVKKAGLDAARLAEAQQDWTQAVKFYRRLQTMLPSLKESLQSRIQKAEAHPPPGQN